MAPRKTDTDTPLEPSDQSEQDYFAIARRQADALNELEAKIDQFDLILRDLVTQYQQVTFRLEAVEAKPVPVDYGDRPRQADDRPRRVRPANPLCPECGCSLPSHFDHCSSYLTPKERVA